MAGADCVSPLAVMHTVIYFMPELAVTAAWFIFPGSPDFCEKCPCFHSGSLASSWRYCSLSQLHGKESPYVPTSLLKKRRETPASFPSRSSGFSIARFTEGPSVLDWKISCGGKISRSKVWCREAFPVFLKNSFRKDSAPTVTIRSWQEGKRACS